MSLSSNRMVVTYYTCALQVQAFIRGNAVAGVVQAALESEGTPNELVQTDLTQARPEP